MKISNMRVVSSLMTIEKAKLKTGMICKTKTDGLHVVIDTVSPIMLDNAGNIIDPIPVVFFRAPNSRQSISTSIEVFAFGFTTDSGQEIHTPTKTQRNIFDRIKLFFADILFGGPVRRLS